MSPKPALEKPTSDSATVEQVENCYRLILGREPDAEGLRVHVEARLPVDRVVQSFINSPEFRSRHWALTTLDLFGHPFLLPVQSMYGEGYEDYVFHRLMGYAGPGKTFLDVGANIGMFAVHAAMRQSRVIAVEARPSNCSLLLENARRAGVPVELHPLAVSDCRGYSVLQMAPDSENAELRDPRNVSLGDHIVALGVLDDLIGDRQVDVMKIDIEGHEYRALLGAEKMLARCRPVIVSEYSPKYLASGSGVSGAQYLEFLQGFGYSTKSVLHRSGTAQKIAGADEADAICRELGHHVDLLLEPAS